MGYFPFYPVISLALNSISMSRREAVQWHQMSHVLWTQESYCTEPLYETLHPSTRMYVCGLHVVTSMHEDFLKKGDSMVLIS